MQTCLLHTINADYSAHDFFYRLTLFGMGLGFTMSPFSNCAIGSLPKDKIGVGSGVFNSCAMFFRWSVGVVPSSEDGSFRIEALMVKCS